MTARRLLSDKHGESIDWKSPTEPSSWEALELVHDVQYLKSMVRSSTAARVVEVPFVTLCPRSWIKSWFLEPCRWSVACSLLAARCALQSGMSACLGGGFHHAKRSGGEGFCFVNDIAYLLETLRCEGTLPRDGQVLYIDLDVHQGNGVSDYYHTDPRVRTLDVFNRAIYPVWGEDISSLVEVSVALEPGCADREYLVRTTEGLQALLEGSDEPVLAIYNAGSDIFEEDLLGGLKVSAEAVSQRDRVVLDELRKRKIPTLILASGGYSNKSALMLAELCSIALDLSKDEK